MDWEQPEERRVSHLAHRRVCQCSQECQVTIRRELWHHGLKNFHFSSRNQAGKNKAEFSNEENEHLKDQTDNKWGFYI